MNKRLLNPVLVGLIIVRKILSEIKILWEKQVLATYTPVKIGETKKLEILPLFEAVSENELQSGFGVSYLVRTDTATILFDVGNNPKALSPSPLEHNMSQLGISLEEINLMVISHRHPDHVGGWKWWKRNSFSMNGTSQRTLGTLPIYITEKLIYPGSNLTFAKLPLNLAEGVTTTGRFTYFEPYPLWQITPQDSEQVLAVNVAGRGIVLIVGCGHMGLGALLNRSKTIFKEPVIGIVGGLHYGKSKPESLIQEITSLKECNPQVVALSPHDSGPAAVDIFQKEFAKIYKPIRVGVPIEFP